MRQNDGQCVERIMKCVRMMDSTYVSKGELNASGRN